MAWLHMDEVLDLALSRGASDVHFAVGMPVVVKVSGRLAELTAMKIGPEDVESLVASITPQTSRDELAKTGATEFQFSFRDRTPFDVSVFRQRDHLGMVLRSRDAGEGMRGSSDEDPL